MNGKDYSHMSARGGGVEGERGHGGILAVGAGFGKGKLIGHRGIRESGRRISGYQDIGISGGSGDRVGGDQVIRGSGKRDLTCPKACVIF